MIARGHTVIAVAPDIRPETAVDLNTMGVRYHTVDMSRRGINPVSDVRLMLQLAGILRREKIDLMLCYTIKPNIWGGLAAALAGVRSAGIVTGLGYMFSQDAASGFKLKTIKAAARWLYRQAAKRHWRLIFQNPDDLVDFEKAGCLPYPDRSRLVAGSGVDMTHYERSPLPDAPVFLMISRLLVEKGVREFGQASVAILAQYPHARCVLVGGHDPGFDTITADELDSWVAGGLDYRGHQNDVRSAIKDARIYVLPSYREGTPRSVLEAMACGRPIITTDAPGCRETVIDGKTGYQVRLYDVDDLFEKMERMILYPDACLQMGADSYAYAQQKFDVTKVNADMMVHLAL